MRLFLATAFPEDVLRTLNERVSPIKTRVPPATWVRPETQHLTFAFLGEQDEALIDALSPLVEEELRAVGRFEGILHGSGFFPHPRHARVGWIGLEPEQSFIGVAQAVREVVTANGVALDGADFKPHLTMMRIREGWPPASIDLFARSLRDFQSAPFRVDAVTLFSSKLDPKGAVHTPLRVFPLR